ncbi:DUF1376 domain-containing protein [Aureimonas pseudogalii]|uniref:Uncharacterized protein YdaU (DUF1376 family) n=1 Tax=Aureimonas pseudogalii TaxID=1744844 RepID=A0A7W6E9J0_9HYPH|nr:DUF1376 domain-containing protein [Aureimonas pseudogalii]MBB3997237.1 uncharacterized protein YdaU (DUF1376 family) [Aureimonas pseudogalii]
MNGLPYYKAYPRDFIEGTIGMPFEVKCAYRVILDLIYMQGGNLPDDNRYISGLLGCSIRKWTTIRSALIEADKIQVSGEFLTNYRAVSELETLAKLQDKQRENGSHPKKNNDLAKPRLNHTEPEPDKLSKDACASASAAALKPEKPTSSEPDPFDAFWAAYPKRDGPNPKKPAKLAFDRAVKRGVPVEAIMAAVVHFARKHPKPSAFCPQATTWLNQDRFSDEGAVPAPKPQVVEDDAYWNKALNMARVSRRWLVEHWGRVPGHPDCRVPSHLLKPKDGDLWHELYRSVA